MLDGNQLSELTLAGAPRRTNLPDRFADNRSHLLANALVAAKTGAPAHLAALADDVLHLLPRRPRASQNLRAITVNQSSDPTLLDDAVVFPWLAWDSLTHRNVLAVDIDHGDALDRWLALPDAVRPMLVIDPWTGRAHAVAVLEDPALLRTRAEVEADRIGKAADVPIADRAEPGPQMMADLGGRLLAAALGGTLLPPGSLTKSPWGRTANLIGTRCQIGPRPLFREQWAAIQEHGLMWHTLPGSGPLKLRDLVRELAGTWWHDTAGASARFSSNRYAKKRGDPSWLSRNTWVFDLTRWWAYDRVEKDGGAILDQAMSFNAELAQPLAASEVQATARSITRFMNSRYRPSVIADDSGGRDRAEGAGLDAKGRQALAGRNSAVARASSTDARITATVIALQAAGAALTQSAIAEAAGIGINTVARRWKRLPSPPNASLSGSAAVAAPGPKAPPPKNQNPSTSSLADLARRDRAVRVAVTALTDVAAVMLRPGARPQPVPVIPSELRADPRVCAAHAAAEAARRDAVRRAEARVAREAAEDRAAEMLIAAGAPDGGRAWWTAHVTELANYWNAVEGEHADNPRRLAAIRGRREAVFVARHRQWKRAQRSARLEISAAARAVTSPPLQEPIMPPAPPTYADGDRPAWIRPPGWQPPPRRPMPTEQPSPPPEPPTTEYLARLRRRPPFLLTKHEKRILAGVDNGACNNSPAGGG